MNIYHVRLRDHHFYRLDTVLILGYSRINDDEKTFFTFVVDRMHEKRGPEQYVYDSGKYLEFIST